MTHSLGEIEALSKRAARGAGMTWGLAEEAGRAARWLAARDQPGVQILADVLTCNDGVEMGQRAPISLSGVWQGAEGTLCPIATGATLSDCADLLGQGGQVQMAGVTHAMLLAPFAATVARAIDAPVSLSWAGVVIGTDGTGLWIDGTVTRGAVDVVCTRAEPPRDAPHLPGLRGVVADADWARLGVFAQRTYAPATEASRLSGAGAGTSDND